MPFVFLLVSVCLRCCLLLTSLHFRSFGHGEGYHHLGGRPEGLVRHRYRLQPPANVFLARESRRYLRRWPLLPGAVAVCELDLRRESSCQAVLRLVRLLVVLSASAAARRKQKTPCLPADLKVVTVQVLATASALGRCIRSLPRHGPARRFHA